MSDELQQPPSDPKNPSGMQRGEPDNLSLSRRALCKEWQDKIIRAKKHWERVFVHMREDMDFFMGNQWKHGNTDDKYVANIVQRHVQQRVSSLYAKNPKAVAKRRKTIDFTMWDENPATLQAGQVLNQQAQAMGQIADPNAMALMQDVQQGMEKRRVLDKIARTLEIIFHYIIEQNDLKAQMKQLVRRTCVTGVGYVKLGYHRQMARRPEDVEKITDISEQINVLARLTADAADSKFDENSARMEQLKQMLQELMENDNKIVDEGLVFDFPPSQNIIVDPRCRQIKGFVGAEWVCQEFMMTIDDVKEVYGLDLGTSYTRHESVHGDQMYDPKKVEGELVRVWEIYSKKDAMKYVVAEGFPDFLTEPCCPEIKLKRFWPFFVLAFNEVENDKEIYPPSDVRLLMPIQREYNLARQRLREHRHANRPLYAVPTGMLSNDDIRRLQDREANAVVQLSALQPGQKVGDVIQGVPVIPIDPALYDTNFLFDDILKVVGSQEANMGGTSSSTATEVSVAESSRSAALGSNVDDLDDFLTELTRAAGQVLLLMMDPQTATKIAGPGASWPTLSAQEVADQLLLEVEAGSSGRPNKAAEIANFERLAPTLIQIPGIDPTWLAKEAIKRLDDDLDLTEAVRSALPSIVAMNAQKNLPAQPNTGDPASDPSSQGQEGGDPTSVGQAPGTPGGVQVPNVPEAQMYVPEPPPPPNAV